jgi:undecaprenyl-diphosphatase
MTTNRNATREADEWAIVHVTRRTIWHIKEGWEDLERGHRKRWFLVLLGGFAAIIALTLVLVWIGQALDRRGLLDWERGFILALDRADPVPFSWAIWLESPGNGVVLWPVVIGAAGVAAWRRRPLAALTILGGFIALDAAILLGWKVWERPRPTLIAGGVASPSGSFSAYPSGHVSQTLVAYGLLISFWIERTRHRGERILAWSILAAVTSMVSLGRLRLGAHWPTDVVSGAIAGLAWLFVLIAALRYGEAERRSVVLADS